MGGWWTVTVQTYKMQNAETKSVAKICLNMAFKFTASLKT